MSTPQQEICIGQWAVPVLKDFNLKLAQARHGALTNEAPYDTKAHIKLACYGLSRYDMTRLTSL